MDPYEAWESPEVSDDENEIFDLSDEELDYYAILNVSNDAEQVEITKAYRHQCLLFHPDRHGDPESRKEAEKVFVRIRKAYMALSDPNLRKVYDSVGIRGLSLTGWELMCSSNLPRNIRREYELLKRLRETEVMLQRVHPTGQFLTKFSLCGLFAAHASERYPPQLTGVYIAQNIECFLTTSDKIGLSGRVKMDNGRGDGSVVIHLKRTATFHTSFETSLTLAPDSVTVSGVLARNIFNKSAIILQPTLQYFTSMQSLSPGCTCIYSRGLDPYWQGSIAYHFGLQQSLTTSIIHSHPYLPNFVANLTVAPANISLRTVYAKKYGAYDGKLQASCVVGTNGIMPTLSYDRKLSRHTRIGVNLSFIFPTCILSSKLSIKIGPATYDAKFLLCDNDEDLARALFFGVALPFIGFNLFRVACHRTFEYMLSFFEDRSEIKEANRMSRESAEKILQLMRPQAERIARIEAAKNGLIVIQAHYGISCDEFYYSNLHNLIEDRVLDVTVPLQALVYDSKLNLYSSKHQLPGFYDPCPLQPKLVRIIYRYRGEMYHVVANENVPLSLPDPSHRE